MAASTTFLNKFMQKYFKKRETILLTLLLFQHFARVEEAPQLGIIIETGVFKIVEILSDTFWTWATALVANANASPTSFLKKLTKKLPFF